MGVHCFQSELDFSHKAQRRDFMRGVYEHFFPGAAVVYHDKDGPWQRGGIDATVILPTSVTFTVDEKTRRGNWQDILLEEWSDYERQVPGWVCKPLMCDYILYSVPAAARAYLLPAGPLQQAWRTHADEWKADIHNRHDAHNHDGARAWYSVNWQVEPEVLLRAICETYTFTPAAPSIST